VRYGSAQPHAPETAPRCFKVGHSRTSNIFLPNLNRLDIDQSHQTLVIASCMFRESVLHPKFETPLFHFSWSRPRRSRPSPQVSRTRCRCVDHWAPGYACKRALHWTGEIRMTAYLLQQFLGTGILSPYLQGLIRPGLGSGLGLCPKGAPGFRLILSQLFQYRVDKSACG